MPNASVLLDKALDMGQEELGALASGDIDSAEQLAHGRGSLIDDALKFRETIRMDELLNKLKELQRLQGRITTEARKLQSSLREDLNNIKQQNRRISGYGGSVRGGQVNRNVYINKCG